jgi:hypothetical protein
MCGSEIVNAWQLLKKKTMLLVHIVCALCLWEKKNQDIYSHRKSKWLKCPGESGPGGSGNCAPVHLSAERCVFTIWSPGGATHTRSNLTAFPGLNFFPGSLRQEKYKTKQTTLFPPKHRSITSAQSSLAERWCKSPNEPCPAVWQKIHSALLGFIE